MKRVLILLGDGFEPLELAGFTDVLGWAIIDGEEPIEVVTTGLRRELRSTFGAFTLRVDHTVDELDLSTFDALAIPGGMDRVVDFYADAYADPFTDVIRHFSQHEQPVAAVCVAALSLGKAGVVEGRKATTYNLAGSKRPGQLKAFGVDFVDRAIVRDGAITTSSGPGTAVEVAFTLLEQLTSNETVARIRELMCVPEPPADWQAPAAKVA